MSRLLKFALHAAVIGVGLLSVLRDGDKPQTFTGAVARVVDGDTIKVTVGDDTYTVRLDAIDAPELAQSHGEDARRALSRAVLGKSVEVRWSKTDRYGRRIGKVFRQQALVNLSLVEDGHAWHYVEYDDDATYGDAQEAAKQDKLGLWRNAKPQAPWDYRSELRAKRKQAKEKTKQKAKEKAK